jgi:uncharacterized protein (TIGR00369 family)
VATYNDEAMRERIMREVALHAALELKIVSIEPGRVVVEMPARGAALNGSGNLHGGAIATLLDVACGMAAGTATGIDRDRQTLVTSDMHLRFLGRAKTDVVRAEGKVLRLGRQLAVVEGRVVDGDNHLVASADTSFMVVELRTPLPAADKVDPRALDL